MIELVRLRAAAEVEKHSAQIARWIFESGPRFFTWRFGDENSAVTSLRTWTCRANSEFSGMFATLAFSEGDAIGMFLALSGREIPARRRADLLALIKDAMPDRREALKDHLQHLAALTLGVEETEIYIRTVAVEASQRGRGIGKRLVERAIEDGRAAGFTRFRLDVDSDNEPALSLYRKLGFESIYEGAVPEPGLRIQSLLLKTRG